MNDVSHHEATMQFLYGYVVRKNVSHPGYGKVLQRDCMDYFKLKKQFVDFARENRKFIVCRIMQIQYVNVASMWAVLCIITSKLVLYMDSMVACI